MCFKEQIARKLSVNKKEDSSRLNSIEGVASESPENTTESPEISAASETPISFGKLNLPKIISFDSIARCGEEVWIESDGKIYRLRRTKQGKLILTK